MNKFFNKYLPLALSAILVVGSVGWMYYRPQIVFATAVGPTFAGTGADTSLGNFAFGARHWTNPGNITADDGSYATATIGSGHSSTFGLLGTNFGFSIPAGATINGVLMEIKAKKDASGCALGQVDDGNWIQMFKAGSPTGSGKFPGNVITSTDAYYSYGSASDLWGATLTSTDVNNSGFGFGWTLECSGANDVGVYADAMRVTVTYTAAASSPAPAPAQVTNTGVRQTQLSGWITQP